MNQFQYIKGALKNKRARGVQKETSRSLECETSDNIVACVTKSGSDKSAEVHFLPLEGHVTES